MSAPRTHALLALLGATSLGEMGCFGDNDGAQPTSSASSVGTPDSGIFDPYQSTGSGSGSTGTGTDSGTAGPGSDNSDPSAGSAETGVGTDSGPTSNSDGPGTTGPSGTGGTGMTDGSSGSGSSGYFGSTGYYGSTGLYGSTGYYDAEPEDDGWYTGLGAVECGDIPLRICP